MAVMAMIRMPQTSIQSILVSSTAFLLRGDMRRAPVAYGVREFPHSPHFLRGEIGVNKQPPSALSEVQLRNPDVKLVKV